MAANIAVSLATAILIQPLEPSHLFSSWPHLLSENSGLALVYFSIYGFDVLLRFTDIIPVRIVQIGVMGVTRGVSGPVKGSLSRVQLSCAVVRTIL